MYAARPQPIPTRRWSALSSHQCHLIRGSTSFVAAPHSWQAIAEKSVLQGLLHPFIVKLHFAFQDERHLFLVLDFIGGGDLFSLLEDAPNHQLSEGATRFYSAEMVLALEHLHSHCIMYRDLKPENIMLGVDGHVVLTDFGLSKQMEADERTTTMVGTPAYLAPEVIHGRGCAPALRARQRHAPSRSLPATTTFGGCHSHRLVCIVPLPTTHRRPMRAGPERPSARRTVTRRV